MSVFHDRSARIVKAGWLPAILTLSWLVETASAETVPKIVRIERDRKLVVEVTDAATDAPRVACVILPVGNLDSLRAAFELNHRSDPDFVAGRPVT